MRKTLVIFDVDGTLVYSNRIDSQCFADTYEAIYKRPFPSIDWRRYPHVTDHTIFSSVIEEHFERTVSDLEIQVFQDHFVELLEVNRQTRPNEFLPVPDARETIVQLLNDPNYVIGIGTGGWKRPAHLKLRHVEIPVENLFVSAADGKATREAILEEVIENAIERYPTICRTVYVGDAIWDVETTRNLQVNFIGIRRNGDLHILENQGATKVLQDYTNRDLFFEAIESATPPL